MRKLQNAHRKEKTMQRRKTIFLISSALLLVLACNLGTAAPPPSPLSVDGGIETAVMQTLRASGVMLATPVYTNTPLPPTLTPTITLTPTPAIPYVSVSRDTSCRSGPGMAYTYRGALRVGEKAQIVGKHTPSNYWIIVNPDGDGDCWLWGEYAAVDGNTDQLIEYVVPAVPTPPIPNAPSNFTASNIKCGDLMEVTLSWTDNSINEDGFKLYQNGAYTHIIGYNRTAHIFSRPYQPGQAIQFQLSAFNVTGESARQITSATCP